MIDPKNPDYRDTPASASRPAFGFAPTDPHAAPKVSIVVPFYNGATDVFDETALSIFRQSFQQWEMLLINDGTTNPIALATLDRYRNIDPRIRVIDFPENRGLCAARNAGFAAARAEYIMLLDDDDLLELTTIEKLYWHLESYPEWAVANGWSLGFGAKEYLWPHGFERNEGLLESNSATGRAMVRKSAHAAIGGYDESIRHGMEDWEFWLRLAEHGMWGSTLPEYFDWYRRRPDHVDRWADMDGGERQRNFRKRLRDTLPRIYSGQFPKIELRWPLPFDPIREELPCENRLTKTKPRVLLILPWTTLGGADKFNRDLVQQLTQRGWEVTIATTNTGDHSWMPAFARHTPDIFAMHHFLRPTDYPAFLRYLIQSRGHDVVLMSNSEFAYQVLPYLRAHCPTPVYADLCHSDAPRWQHGGYPRYSVANQDLLDLNIVSTAYLKSYLTARGADEKKIEVFYSGIDADLWRPSPEDRSAMRAKLELPDDLCVIVFAGRFHADKQPPVLMRTLHALAERGAPFVALLIGEGPDRGWIDEYIAAHNLGQTVRVLGVLSDDEIRSVVQASDILFLPSLWEGIAVTLFEAMACELVVVGADVGGQRELCTPECGYLLPKGTEAAEIEQYAGVLAKLVADPQRRRALGKAARQRILSGFSLDAMGERMDELLRRPRSPEAEAAAPRIPPRLGRELGTLAVELQRRGRAMDEYWTLLKERGQFAAAPPPSPNGQHGAEEELRWIENSRTWRMVQRLKGNSAYRALARLRWGDHWDQVNVAETAEQRLERIKGSNAYRAIRAVKRTAAYRWYARRKYGPNFDA